MFQNRREQNLLSYTSMGQYYLRGKGVDIRRHQEAEEYQTQLELSLAHTSNVISLTEQCATVRRHHEAQLLLDLLHAPDKDPEQSAVHIARSARDTLVAEEEVVMSKLREAQLIVSKLQNALEVAQSHIQGADDQLGSLLDRLRVEKKPIPQVQHILAPKFQRDVYVPTECFFGKNPSGGWGGYQLSELKEEQGRKTSENSMSECRSTRLGRM